MLLGVYAVFLCLRTLIRRLLPEAETGSRLTYESCAIFVKSNHVVLITMPNMFVDVGLPTVDVS